MCYVCTYMYALPNSVLFKFRSKPDIYLLTRATFLKHLLNMD